MYGQEKINAQSSMVSGTWSIYTVHPLEVNHIDQDNEPCISEADKMTDTWECMTNHMYSRLDCTLPLVDNAKAKNKNIDLCSSPEEYDLFQEMTVQSMN